MGAVDIIERQTFETKNRIGLILLDSNFEIALKEFIVSRTDLFPEREYGNARIAHIFSKRHLVINEVIAKIVLPPELLDKARHFYGLRNKLIHERATVDPTENDVRSYRSVVQKVLKILFDLRV